MSAMVLDFSAPGLVCALGFSAAAACAALRSGVANFSELRYWDKNRLPVIGATVQGVSADLQFGPRLIEILTIALRDSLAGMPHQRTERVPLLLGMAEPERPGSASDWSASMIARVQERLGVGFHPKLSRVLPLGHTAGFEALGVARGLLQSTDIPGCIVCGVDSYINASALFWLDRHWRLKRENHTDGVIPGEAAASGYVQRRTHAAAGRRVDVVGLGFAHEDAPALSEKPLLALGLAAAGRHAMLEAGWGFHDVEFRLSDLTGENYGFRELALVEGRLASVVRRQPQPLWHPADSLGDTGAAAGLVQLVWASEAWARGYAPGERAACFTSAIAGGRAVTLLRSREA